MDFGLGLLGYHGCWEDAAFAEAHGFATAGFVDSPLLGGDPFVCAALAARETSRMRVGTFLAVPSNRTAASTAAAIATVNRLAPGRAFLGLGTGYTSRNTFGLRALSAERLRDYARDCRALLDGAEIEQAGRPVRLLHEPGRYVELEPRVPVYVAADGPKALAAAGSSADGWITTLQFASVMHNTREVFASSLAAVRAAAAEARRAFDDPYVMWSTTACLLGPGERPTAPRVLARVGAHAMMAFHSYADDPRIGEFLPAVIRERLEIYERYVLARFASDPRRRHQEIHRGHLSHLLEGEAEVLTDEIVRATCLVGEPQEVAGILDELEAAGLRNLSLWIPPQFTREAVTELAPLLDRRER
jgi:alkanesulfonate monooxygenase SsuD/methylene tetrahydromethanopterin reductase-like flavin-dependent oxidoreductase (luciferase family)